MTRKDYIALAQAMGEVAHRVTTDEERETLQIVINALAKTLKADNANFDSDRFKDACWRMKV